MAKNKNGHCQCKLAVAVPQNLKRYFTTSRSTRQLVCTDNDTMNNSLFAGGICARGSMRSLHS